MTIDLKSLSAGILLGITLAFSLAATTRDGGTDGRFQITSAASGSGSTFYVVDTRNGQVWAGDRRKKLTSQ